MTSVIQKLKDRAVTTARRLHTIVTTKGARKSLLAGYIKSIYLNRLKRQTRSREGVPYNPEGENILDKDWDVCIILDACRYDTFCEAVAERGWNGNTSSITSLGSSTEEWVYGTFLNRHEDDLAYATANLRLGILGDELDSKVVDYQFTDRDAFDGITTYPETLTDLAIQVAKDNPNKRLLVHYLQPHEPFLPASKRLPAAKYRHTIEPRPPSVDKDWIQEAYRDNLDIALDEVERLLDSLPEPVGKVAITADHGELLGEPVGPLHVPSYDHPSGIRVDELLRVPWHVFEAESRPEITPSDTLVSPSNSENVTEFAEEQLEALGYKT
jgi:hypothetical protein